MLPDKSLTCAACHRRYRWRSDYRTKPCPRCGGTIYPETELAGNEPEDEPRPQPVKLTSTAGTRRWVGDAEVAGRPLGRVFDASCYAVAGIAVVVAGLASTDDSAPPWLPLIGGAGVLYGLRIFLTDGSYWTSTWVYVIALFAVLFALGALA